jgi:NAD(P)-dependent dehydrogenase (short-subunit alcohol dehydrogenase family)
MATLLACIPPASPSEAAPSTLRGRLAVVTGGSAGIGRALAAEVAAAGASVIVGSRRPALGRFEHRTLDLASQASVAAFAEGLIRDGRPIDLLVLNAGVHVPWKRVTTEDGLELHWQVNYLSNFQLAHRLLDLCRRSALKRVVYVASEAHRLAALPGAPLLGFWYRYARSKEAAVTSFQRLAERHPELTVRIVSPGYVDSEIHRHKSRLSRPARSAPGPGRAPRPAAPRTGAECSDPAAGAERLLGPAGARMPSGAARRRRVRTGSGARLSTRSAAAFPARARPSASRTSRGTSVPWRPRSSVRPASKSWPRSCDERPTTGRASGSWAGATPTTTASSRPPAWCRSSTSIAS